MYSTTSFTGNTADCGLKVTLSDFCLLSVAKKRRVTAVLTAAETLFSFKYVFVLREEVHMGKAYEGK